jgi:glycosyltransferase involved in cell wall biosynthesis
MTRSPSGPGFFREHPVRPVAHQDPLLRSKGVYLAPGPEKGVGVAEARPRIGFACQWDEIPERTWSYTPWHLREALRSVTETTDTGFQIPRLSRTVLRAIHTRYHGRLTSTWGSSPLTEAYVERALRRELSRTPAERRCDAVLTMYELAASLPVPFFIYSDISYDAAISAAGSIEAYAASKRLSPSAVARLRDRQVSIYARASGIIAMSHWFARSLVQQTGVPEEKIHVVHAGINNAGNSGHRGTDVSAANGAASTQPYLPVRERPGPRRRLLFAGRRDFYGKGGDLVLAALAVLRREYDARITLTVAGPASWPLPGTPPEGVQFLGTVPSGELAALYDSHDLLVMPSRLEAFGIVFTEALARGLPCVAREAYAMPEIVTPGVSGALVASDDEHELAAVIAATLGDDALYEACHDRAAEFAAYFSWERAAQEMVEIIKQELGSVPLNIG